MNRILVFSASAILFLPFFARAEVVINEVMYNASDGDTDWVEIYNNGNSGVLIKTTGAADAWRISTTDSPSPTKYNLANPDFTIQAGEYVILACDKSTFLSKHASFSGNVVDITASGFSNSGGRLQLYDAAGNSINSANYGPTYGANGDGNSLQKMNDSTWHAYLPTPGMVNQVSTPPPPVATGSLPANDFGSKNTPLDSAVVTESKNKTAETPKAEIKTEINVKDTGFVGLPLSFKATTYGIHGEQLRSGKYFWNFGDGDSKEIVATESAPFSHTYFYSGEYTVTLDYFSNNYFYAEIPDATSTVTIKIIPAQIVISRVGDEKDFFVEITNNTDYPADLSNYFLQSEAKTFIIPRNTILQSKKSLIISPKITNLSNEDKKTLKLMTPDGGVAYDFTATLSSAQIFTKKSAPENILNSENKNQNINLSEMEVSENNLSASAIESEVQNSNNTHSKIVFIIFAIFIGISAGGVYFVRSRGSIPGHENDFEILDE